MLDKIPFEIQIEIIKKLPVKSLIQFQSVSKAFNSMIHTSDFISRYSALQTQPQHLLVYENGYFERKYCAVFDDDTFPQRRITFPIPRFLNWLMEDDYDIIDSSNGLVCLYGYPLGCPRSVPLTGMVIVWNPSVRKAVGVVVPNLGNGMLYWTLVGFGVCCETMDTKIVKITYIIRGIDAESVNSIPSQVEVFTLCTGAWRSPYKNLPRKSIQFGHQSQVVVDGFIYWLATEKSCNKSYNLIVSFDLTTEEFGEVTLPDSLALARDDGNHDLRMNRLRNSLVIAHEVHDEDVNNTVMGIWMRVDGVFTNLYNIKVNRRYEFLKGFRKNGAPIVRTKEDVLEEEYSRELVVYEPNSNNMDNFWTHDVRLTSSIDVYPYMETLLLLDQPDLMVYNDNSMWKLKNKRPLKDTS